MGTFLHIYTMIFLIIVFLVHVLCTVFEDDDGKRALNMVGLLMSIPALIWVLCYGWK